MNLYRLTLNVEVEIEAENIVEARRIASKVRAIRGEVAGARRAGPHDREMLRYKTHTTREARTLERLGARRNGE